MIISLDTETTGIDLVHGAKPFLVTYCELWQNPQFWEWPVDPVTREPQVPESDLADIAELLDAAELIYLHNARFDARALATIGITLPWHKVRDTIIAGHLLGSNLPHNLTDMCVWYLGADIGPLEDNVKKVTQECRKIAKKRYPHWKLADEGVPGMPSVKSTSKRDEDKPWKNDMWLPQALANALVVDGYIHEMEAVGEGWLDACSKYACGDSEHTLYLGQETDKLVRERGLWAIYEHRLEVAKAYCEMESYGVTAVGDYTESTINEFERYTAECEAALKEIAAGYGYELELAEGASLNDNMRDFFYGVVMQSCPSCTYTKRVKHWNGERPNGQVCPKCAKGTKRRPAVLRQLVTTQRDTLNLPVIESKKTGNASLDKDAMQDYLTTLEDGPALEFIELLSNKRTHETALTYMRAYRRFWVPATQWVGTRSGDEPVEVDAAGFYRIHPSLNPTGTDHLRASSNDPNLQNVAGESKEISNKACFGPMPGREWYAMDFKSIEARIPAYESGEPKMIGVFERPNEPPYWGSLYLLSASVLYPDEFWPLAQTEGLFREKYPRLYKQAKFFVLAKNYGAGRRKGDMLSKVKNSYDLVDNEFPKLAALQSKYVQDAERTGYVETLPDRTVDPTRGYPILAAQTEEGRVLSTTPFNYHTSGTACWVKNAALVRCAKQCAEWRSQGFDAHVCLEVHDELLFDFPRGATKFSNRERALFLKGLMEQGGADLIPAIPTPVSVEYHERTWADGEVVA